METNKFKENRYQYLLDYRIVNLQVVTFMRTVNIFSITKCL